MIDWTKATTRPHMQQQVAYDETGIRTFWMVKIIHPDMTGDLFLGVGGKYYEFSTKEEAAAKGVEWEEKCKVTA